MSIFAAELVALIIPDAQDIRIAGARHLLNTILKKQFLNQFLYLYRFNIEFKLAFLARSNYRAVKTNT
jgi:hypothetical protein